MPETSPNVPLPLRVGLLVDSLVQPRWVRDLVARIQQSPFARVVAVVENTPPDKPRRGLLRRVLQNRHLLYSLYTNLDDRLFAGECRPDAFERVTLADLVQDCTTIRVAPVRTRYCDYFAATDVAALRELNLDVALRIGFRILKGEVLKVPRYGIWSYHHGDNLTRRGGPAGFWEVMDACDVTGSILQILTPDLDAGKVIYRSYTATDKRSVRRNRNSLYLKSVPFVLRKLQELAEYGPAVLDGSPDDRAYIPYSAPLYRTPTNRQIVGPLLRLAGRYVVQKVNDTVWPLKWEIAYGIGAAAGDAPPACYRLQHVSPPADRFWADPFPVESNGRHFVFVEELQYATRKGHIAVLELGKDGLRRPPVTVLEEDYHLSYPFVFRWKDRFYMVPESSANRTVDLYECVEFPYRWTRVARMLENVNAADPTLVEVDGLWWLFLSIAEAGVRNYDELHLFYSETPFGPWQAHPRNPVKSDVRSARPAGGIFRWRGDLYRPAQDCSKRYGHSIVIHRIVTLNTQEFRESSVSTILPAWRPDIAATHTLNTCQGMVVVDVMRRRPRMPRLRLRLPTVASTNAVPSETYADAPRSQPASLVSIGSGAERRG